MDDFSVALVGPHPPPYGGVSVHVERLHERLEALGISSRVYCQPSSEAKARGERVVHARLRFSWYCWVLEHAWRCDAGIVHFYEGWRWAPAALVVLLRGKKVVMAFHNQRVTGEMWQRTPRLARWATRRLVRHPRAWWVGATQAVKGQLVEMGVDPARITVAPAYLPPRRGATTALPAPIRDFVGVHSPVLSTYAWQLSRDAQGVDVYGFDLCVGLVRSLREVFPRIGLVLRMSNVADAAYLDDLQARVAADGTKDHVLFTTAPLEDAQALWGASDVHVRATSTDGDAVAVREALDLRVPVVASDASVRPEGTVLFKTRDQEDLTRAVREVLTHHADHVRALQSVAVVDNFPPLLELYRAIA